MCPRLAVADALDLAGVQRIDLRPALAMILVAHPDGEIAQGREASVELGLTPDLDLAVEVADDPAEPGIEEF